MNANQLLNILFSVFVIASITGCGKASSDNKVNQTSSSKSTETIKAKQNPTPVEKHKNLFEAIHDNDANTVKELTKINSGNRANVNEINDDFETPLMVASKKGYSDIVKILLDNSASVNLHKGSQHGFITVEDGAYTNKLGYEKTALLYAADNGHLEIVNLLINNNADIEFSDVYNESALIKAVKKGYIEIVKLLVEKGVLEKEKAEQKKAIHVASEYGREEIVLYLLSKGVDVNTGNENTGTPLSCAALNGQVAMIELLLKNGADINAKENAKNFSMLMTFDDEKHVDIINLLLNKGLDPNTGDLLNSACSFGNSKTAKLLIDKGAQLNKELFKNACKNGHSEIVSLLIKSGLDINENESGSPLLNAVWKNHTVTTRVLIENKADIFARDNMGSMEYCIERAIENNNTNIVGMLLSEYQKDPDHKDPYCKHDSKNKLIIL